MTNAAEYIDEPFDFDRLRVQDVNSLNDLNDFLEPDGDTDADFITQPTTEPGTDLIGDVKEQTAKSKKYQKKAKAPFKIAFKKSLQRQDTLPDAAAILLYAPPITRAIGDLADADEKFASAIDWLTEGIENPYLNLLTAVAPFALQMLRNHEPEGETLHHGIPIPFSKGKRLFTKLKFRIKLGWIRHATDEPIAITNYVFTRPDVIAALAKQGISVGNAAESPSPAPKSAPRKRAPRKVTAPKG